MRVHAEKPWITAYRASLILGISAPVFVRMVEKKEVAVSVQKYPGLAPRYLRKDVERLAQDSVTPASAHA